jgi:hypothetical protein
MLVESQDPERARHFAARLWWTPAAAVDDSHMPDFYAMEALSTLAYAAQVLVEDDPLKYSVWCSDVSLGLLSGFDLTLKVDSDSKDSLRYLELQAQEANIATLSKEPATLSAKGQYVAALTSTAHQRLQEVTDDIIRLRGWDMHATVRSEIAYFLSFPSTLSAEKAAARIGKDAAVRPGNDDWWVTVTHDAPTTLDELHQQEDHLRKIATEDGGKYDGYERGLVRV